ncbi:MULTISPECIES: hypothetical protein [unclassified Bacillus (in: firmicutes)]|uniref:hypothetical protein n=1 Tax=unclassified Bacillus (in: firmicutes) TaxID=185979 RepID=UPI001BEA3E1E|nr:MULTISPECIES: hypothetical protein [unclassified Bacillus (in: firmicutes)]MBT2615331.1 hypothetical protein [Bacillus sp. ISL-78]MBT2628055.1 hypothetical protein [Bacillus sp. ISL-101]MBT2717972.1 hypothetical protein [Bacillus sp. ISL-57]
MSGKKRYQAVEDFKDLQDKDKIYRKGDAFPKPGNKKVEEERLEELLSSENKMGKPVIKEI